MLLARLCSCTIEIIVIGTSFRKYYDIYMCVSFLREKVPFVSVKAHTKLLIRAVLVKDYKLLEELLNDSRQIGSVSAMKTEILKNSLKIAEFRWTKDSIVL